MGHGYFACTDHDFAVPVRPAAQPRGKEHLAQVLSSRTFARYSPREFRQGVLLIGRQAGKSTVLGTTICLFESLVVERRIPAGQRFTALILTPTLRQSTFGKVAEKLRSIPEFADLIEDDAESQGLISLRNGVDIQAVSAVPRFARGFTAYPRSD